MAHYDPLPGHKIQHAPNVFTVNDYECLVLDTHAWPSERVHCELQADGSWLWVVEHFDDSEWVPNAELPVITHGTDCFYFSTNHSYRDTWQRESHRHRLRVARSWLHRTDGAHGYEPRNFAARAPTSRRRARHGVRGRHRVLVL